MLFDLLWFGAAQAAAPEDAGLRQVAGILDYVGADYAGAVSDDGRVLSEPEYAEQLSLLRDASALVSANAGNSDPLLAALDDVRARIERHAPPQEVQDACRVARRALVEGHDLVLEPAGTPDRARAADRYRTLGCDGCHGATGGADTPAAAALDPAPANFLDAERVAGVSPYRAYHALTFGVPGTAMPAFDTIPAAERWDLAFYVLSLRHTGADLVAGEQVFDTAGRPISPTASRLSQLTEDDVRSALMPAVADAEKREAAVAWLRAEAPFRDGGEGPFARARSEIERGAELYRAGRSQEATAAFVTAYLEGIEPREAAIRARDAALVPAIEAAALALREKVSMGAPADDVDALVARLATLLDAAEEEPRTGWGAGTASVMIALREGLEMVLLVTGLLGLVRGSGRPEQARYVHAGWLAALPATAVLWLVAGRLIGGIQRELAEGIAALLASVVLLGVTHWIVGQAGAARWMGFLAKQMRSAGGAGAAWTLFGLAFLAVFREGLEIVLFYQALLLDAGPTGASAVWGGALAGLALLGVAVLALVSVGKRLKPRPIMLASSVLLAALSVTMVGKGVRALQEADVLPLHGLSFPEFQLLGVHPTWEGLGAQVFVLLLLLASAAPSRRPASTPSPGT
ncbi:MAG: FTR1 family protein [Myxococcota bacterium]